MPLGANIPFMAQNTSNYSNYLILTQGRFIMPLPKKFSVIGAGQMGSGIAQVASQLAKIQKVFLYDSDENQITKSMMLISKIT